MDLLERAGLVRRVGEDGEMGAGSADAPSEVTGADAELSASSPPTGSAPPIETVVGVSLEQIYADAGVPPCAYPAERLLRLLDGLKAMDEGMRRQTIQAIDAADDSWAIDDPKRDAAAKVAAIERHAASIRAGLAQAEQDTQAQLEQLTQRQESSVSEIRRQIGDLEALLAREIARGAQDSAGLEAALQTTKADANRELAELARASGALTGLIAQFGSDKTT